jgi:hypothetical protein
MASLMASMTAVLALGVSPTGQGSSISPMSSTRSERSRSSESGWEVMPMTMARPRCLASSSISSTSRLLPLVEKAIITSSGPTSPRSP